MKSETKQKGEQTLRVALFSERAGNCTGWVAKCLDFDLVAQGDSPEAAQRSFVHALQGQIALSAHFGEDPFVSVEETSSPKAKRQSEPKMAARKWSALKLSYQRLSEPEVVPAFE